MTKKWQNSEGKFKALTSEEITSLEENETKEYLDALNKNREEKEIALAKQIKDLEDKAEKSAEEMAELVKLKTSLNGVTALQIKDLINTVKQQGQAIEKGSNGETKETFESRMKKSFDDVFGSVTGKSADNVKKHLKKEHRGGVSFEINKATQTYGDITPATDLAQMRAGITDLVVRQDKFRALFSMIPLSTEYFKYMRQSSVVRDAKGVAVCSDVTSLTKEEIVLETMTVQKIKDIIDFCLDFIADYPFMMSRIRRLIEQSLSLEIDRQILLGTGTGNEINSISSYASEFSAINPACDISLSIQEANYIDLIRGMITQIYELGQQNAFNPDVVILNRCDFFILISSLKDADNNYLTARGLTNSGGQWFIDGAMVMWSPIVPQNQCFVFDSTKGELLDRQVLNLEIATESGTDWESEQAKLKGFERLNLFVDPNFVNAFMKCTDVATAILSITAV